MEDLLCRNIDKCPVHSQGRNKEILALSMQGVRNPWGGEIGRLMTGSEELFVHKSFSEDTSLCFHTLRKLSYMLALGGEALLRPVDVGCERIQLCGYFLEVLLSGAQLTRCN